MIQEILNNVKESQLWQYGWSIIEPDDFLDYTIEVGEYVKFYDDELDEWSWGVYMGWYEDLSADGDTSPYTNEAYEGVTRVVIEDCVINPDGTLAIRTNTALPENVFSWHEATNTPMQYDEVMAS